jgi:hypothetical protein
MSIQSTIIPIQVETAQMPEPQTRGYLMNLVHSLSPTRLELEIQRIAEAGFNLLVFPVYNNGWTLFPCKATAAYHYPSINPLFKKWDPVAKALELAGEAGLQVWGHARLHHFHPRNSIVEHKLLKTRSKWRARAHPAFLSTRTRIAEQRHACPLNREYWRFLGDLLGEVCVAYPIEGLMLNYTGLGLRGGRLEASPFCFCQSCCAIYRESHDADLIEDAAGPALERVRLWQMEQAHEGLSYLRHRLTRMRRTLRLIARVAPDWRQQPLDRGPLDEGSVLMNWPELLGNGLIEEVVVDHDGEACGPHFSSRVAADYAYLGDRTLFVPMVKIEKLEELRVATQLPNRLPVSGFIAEFQSSFSEEDTRFIRAQFFPDNAVLPESSPVMTAAYLLDRVRQAHVHNPIVRDLLGDILRLLSRQLPLPRNFDLLEMIEQNLSGLEQAIRRGRLERIEISEEMLCDLGLARRFVRLACLDVRS